MLTFSLYIFIVLTVITITIICLLVLHNLNKINNLNNIKIDSKDLFLKKWLQKAKKIIISLCLIFIISTAAFQGYFDGIFKTEEEKYLEKIASIDVKTLFKLHCASCHAENASGGLGPNLTDNYWIHGAKSKELLDNISNGFSLKGMPHFSDILSKLEIDAMARYVESLIGSNVKGKKPQGYLYEKEGKEYVKKGQTMVYAEITVADDIPIIPEGGNVKNGKKLFNAILGCAHCHGTNAYGHIDNRDIKVTHIRYGKNWKRVVDKVLHQGRQGTAMPEWSYLDMQKLKDIKAFIVSVQKKQ